MDTMGLVVVLFVFSVLAKPSVATPFLYNAPRAFASLASSASATASQPSLPASNIVDFRRNEEKTARLQQEANPDMIADNEENTLEDEGEEMTNEASPSLVHKKVNKILTKLRLIAQLKNAVHHMEGGNRENDEEFAREVQRFDKGLEENAKQLNNNDETILQSKETNTQQIAFPKEEVTDAQKEIPLDSAGGPHRVHLNIAERILNHNADGGQTNAKQEVENTEENNGVGSRFRDIGIFFTELLGSLVGLAYGAAAQISNAQAQPAAVVTTSASF